MFRSLQRVLTAGAVTAALFAALPAQAGPYSALYVFGDSLSDDGNNKLAGLYDPTQVITGNSYIPDNTYAAGVYSNGPVWASYYASMLGLALTPSLAGGGDYAFGGATTGTPGPGPGGFPYSLQQQAAMYLQSVAGAGSPNALYVVAGGGNDARATLTALASAPPADVPGLVAAAAATFAANVGSIVSELETAGAKHIVVWDTPNLGLAPAVVAGGGAQVGSFLASAMNGALTAALQGDAAVSIFDIFGLGTKLATDPAAFGLTNATDACGAVAGADCSTYAYWDGIHPTTVAHQDIAEAMYALTVPEPQTWALMAFGLGAVAWTARRRKV
jgi:outer membrane lipase/esterase